MKDDELKKQEVVNAESEKQNVTTLNEKLDFSEFGKCRRWYCKRLQR
mgnify:CR=1 FL=1